MTDRISQQVKSNVTSPSLDRSILFEIIPAVTQGGENVAQDVVDDDEDQGQVMGDVQEFIAAGRTWRNLHKLSWLTTNMMWRIYHASLPKIYRSGDTMRIGNVYTQGEYHSIHAKPIVT